MMGKLLEELFCDEASGGEDSESESSSELSHDSEPRMWGWHFLSENPDDSCNVVHVVFGDQLIFWLPFVKRFALLYQTVVCLSCLSVCNLGVLWPNSRASSRIMYCGHSTQYSHLVG